MIIPIFNEEKTIGDVIKIVGSWPMQPEIVVVDDGSTDGTLEILKNLEKSLPDFKFTKQNHKGPGAARNLGAKMAKGGILVFVDADMTFETDFIKNLVKPIEDDNSKGTFSKEEYVSNWGNPWARSWNINEGWEEKRRHPVNYPDFQPVFRAILKSEFDRVGGFTPGGYDDDWSLYKKLGYQAMNAPGAVFYHKNPAILLEVFRQAKWIGKRKYKLGTLGNFYALVRASLPFSLIIGVYKAFLNRNLHFLVFKTVYDFGIFVGILELIIKNKKVK